METKYWILIALIVVLLLVLYKKQENGFLISCNPQCGHSQYCDYGTCKTCNRTCTNNEVCIYGTCIEPTNH